MKIRDCLRIFGLGERRCGNCLKPYFPEENGQQAASAALCPECATLFVPYPGLRCALCGDPVEEESKKEKAHPVCSRCCGEPPPWHGHAYFGLYEGPLRDLVLRLKFDGELHIARILADFLEMASSCLPKPDFLAPMPQFPGHLRERGFNQAYEIAANFARKTGLCLAGRVLERKRHSPPQEGLTAAERRMNVRDAFSASALVNDKVVWIVDDVMTSGATCSEAATSLLSAGAREVHCLFVARTPLH